MLSREWKTLIVVAAAGVGAMVYLVPLVSELPPWVPQEVVETCARVKGYAATGEPPVVAPGVNVMITGMAVTFACIWAYFWWISRPLVIRCASREGPQR